MDMGSIKTRMHPGGNMHARPCPKECTFDWAEFEICLRIAVTHMIEEQSIYVHKTSISELMAFVLAKQEAREKQQAEEITWGDS